MNHIHKLPHCIFWFMNGRSIPVLNLKYPNSIWQFRCKRTAGPFSHMTWRRFAYLQYMLLFLCGVCEHSPRPVFDVFHLWWWWRKCRTFHNIPFFHKAFRLSEFSHLSRVEKTCVGIHKVAATTSIWLINRVNLLGKLPMTVDIAHIKITGSWPHHDLCLHAVNQAWCSPWIYTPHWWSLHLPSLLFWSA